MCNLFPLARENTYTWHMPNVCTQRAALGRNKGKLTVSRAVVPHPCNSSTWEVEARGWQVGGQPGRKLPPGRAACGAGVTHYIPVSTPVCMSL
jgi:hypothetical protein